MSDFLDELAREGAPVERDVTVGEKTGKVFFRVITAGERQRLVKGMKLAHTPGAKGTIDIDLAQNEEQRHLIVFFSVCDAQGRRHYKSVDDIKKLPAPTVLALAEHAQQVNRDFDEDDDPGKS